MEGILFPQTIEQNLGVQMHFTAKTIEVNRASTRRCSPSLIEGVKSF